MQGGIGGLPTGGLLAGNVGGLSGQVGARRGVLPSITGRQRFGALPRLAPGQEKDDKALEPPAGSG
jgi:hypothetical protein